MRALFGYAKAIGFVFLTGYVGSERSDAPGTWLGSLYGNDPFAWFGWGAVWLAVALTIVRGVPVIVDAWEVIVASSRSRAATMTDQSTPNGQESRYAVNMEAEDLP